MYAYILFSANVFLTGSHHVLPLLSQRYFRRYCCTGKCVCVLLRGVKLDLYKFSEPEEMLLFVHSLRFAAENRVNACLFVSRFCTLYGQKWNTGNIWVYQEICTFRASVAMKWYKSVLFLCTKTLQLSNMQPSTMKLVNAKHVWIIALNCFRIKQARVDFKCKHGTQLLLNHAF